MKKIFNILDVIIGFINRQIAAIGIIGGVFLAFANVIARYVFNYSITWASELTVYMFLWSMFFAVAYCFKLDGHISIDLVVQNVNKRLSKYIILFTRVVTFTFLIVVAYYGYEYLQLVIELEETSIDLEIPMWIPYMVIPVSFTFAAYRVAEHFVKLLQIDPDDMEFVSETSDLLRESKIEDILDDVHKKTGGML